jgi:Arc/MetJ-type ribon-helix-helix transcriptional regulator
MYIILYMEKVIIPLSMPKAMAQELDILVKNGEFNSRNEALRFGVRMLIMMMRRTHDRSEDYAYDEIREGIIRGKKADVS